MRKLILRNFQSPGDIVMLTAAVRDLHRAHPGEFLTDVRTSCPALWEHNPHVTPIADDEPGVEVIDCHYPLIHRSNQVPCHFLHGFPAYLNEQLGLSIRVTEFKGDIHISDDERAWFDRVESSSGPAGRSGSFVSGGKHDFTIKWWDPARMQQVVRLFSRSFRFRPGGRSRPPSPPDRGCRRSAGSDDLRQLVRLVYHAQGVVSPISLLMHLAAAVETKPGAPRNRPCVVVAGGREPPHWTAYPHHQFIHTVGALRCCDNGGCWRSRTLPLGDGDEKDRPEALCLDVVGTLPRCMDMITADEVIRRIELYLLEGQSDAANHWMSQATFLHGVSAFAL